VHKIRPQRRMQAETSSGENVPSDRCTSPRESFPIQLIRSHALFQHIPAPRRENLIARPRFESTCVSSSPRSVLDQPAFSGLCMERFERSDDKLGAGKFGDRVLSFKRKYEEMIEAAASDPKGSTAFRSVMTIRAAAETD
jgi:hypothetical protein